jgi:Protein of unknown function (DUF2844)
MKSLTLLKALAIAGVLSATVVVLSSPMWAALGDNAASVLTDQASMKGTLNSTDKQTYVVHEITASTGAKVREYVSPAGAVFAVAWDGQFPPNFQQLLGPYYQQVQDAAAQQKNPDAGSEQQAPRRRGPVVIQTPGIVFVQTGHMRSFHGQAYIPQLVPQGVAASDIR